MHKYNLGITTASLYFVETARLVKEYSRTGDWETVKGLVLNENILQKTHQKTALNIYNEVKKRFSFAYPWEIEYLRDSEDPSDWKFITLSMTARYYRLLSDVITDLIHFKWEGGDTLLEKHEIPNYVESLEADHPELLEITDRSMEDLKQTLKRDIKDGGLLEKVKGTTFRITVPSVSYELKQLYMDKGSAADLKYLLIKYEEIKRIKGM